jgi:hypothetical protein
MPRLFMGPLPSLSWLSSLAGPAPDAGVDAPAAPSPPASAGVELAFLDECGINSQIAARRLRVLQRLGALLRRHVDADAARRRHHREQIRSLVRLRSDAFAACARLRAPSTTALPKSAAVLLAHLHAATSAITSSDCSVAEQQQLTLADRARSAVAVSTAHVHALELELQQLAAATRASLGTLERLSVKLMPAASSAVRRTGGSGRDWAAMPLPVLYRPGPVGETPTGRRISECLSHLRLASEILHVFAPLPARTPPAAKISAAALPSRLTAASSSRPAPHLADASSVIRQGRAFDPDPEFESPEEDLPRDEEVPARSARTEELGRGRGRPVQSGPWEIVEEEEEENISCGMLEQWPEESIRNERPFSTDRERKAPSVKQAARHADSLRRLHPSGTGFGSPSAASATARRGKSQHGCAGVSARQTGFNAEPDGVLVPYPRQALGSVPNGKVSSSGPSSKALCSGLNGKALGAGAATAGSSGKRRIEPPACGPKVFKRKAGDGRAVRSQGAQLPHKVPHACTSDPFCYA